MKKAGDLYAVWTAMLSGYNIYGEAAQWLIPRLVTPDELSRAIEVLWYELIEDDHWLGFAPAHSDDPVRRVSPGSVLEGQDTVEVSIEDVGLVPVGSRPSILKAGLLCTVAGINPGFPFIFEGAPREWALAFNRNAQEPKPAYVPPSDEEMEWENARYFSRAM